MTDETYRELTVQLQREANAINRSSVYAFWLGVIVAFFAFVIPEILTRVF